MSNAPKSITLTLPYPISANRYWATRIITPKATRKPMAMTYVTPEAKAYKETVARLARAAGVRDTIKGRVRLDVKLFPHRPLDYKKRQRDHGANWDDTVQCIDLGNAEKVLSDALKEIVTQDDKWYWKISLERMEPDGESRLEVTVTEIQMIQPQAAMF